MVDSKTVISQVQAFQLILHDIHAEGMVLGESFQVAALIEKLPPTWKDFTNYLKHKCKEMKLEDLIVRLRVEEYNRQSEKKAGNYHQEAKANVVEQEENKMKVLVVDSGEISAICHASAISILDSGEIASAISIRAEPTCPSYGGYPTPTCPSCGGYLGDVHRAEAPLQPRGARRGVYLLNYVMSMFTRIFSGHLGNLELAAASLGNNGIQTFAFWQDWPAQISFIVTREAIYYCLGDCCSKTSLVNWALPYAQRYIYNMYPDRYIQLKQTGFEILQHLQIVVVDELFYRNVIKRGIASKKRFQCNCLLQGNVLYIARESDSHSVFMELSGSLVDGAPKIHLANFLHLITTMAESGSTEEQTELFILNKQQVQKLPHEESIWSLPALPSSALIDKTPMAAFVSTAIDDPKPSNRKKSKIYSNWPPANWKTAPDFGEKNKFSLGTNVVYDSVDTIVAPNEPNSGSTNFSDRMVVAPDEPNSGSTNFSDRTVVAPDEPNSSSTNFSNRDQLSLGTANAKQAMLTGRLGEYVAYEYFVRKVGEALVKWVNESTETGLPCDIVIGDDEENREYIEVKATEYVSKDWFNISEREWQYAVSKGESFSVARVVLVGSNLDPVSPYIKIQQGYAS
ncbi:hypothetical protein RJ639_041521 [Escallonia herrerae]|uniref:Protein NO VEIN C-terminal domain-containing protein n=1 Tax=Escallonia herrerae TaxID=1293975 RepID=A0AA89B1I9_9ASTE|nr:hypothetical protein RJ639_041521 [Escallonia herrerae]